MQQTAIARSSDTVAQAAAQLYLKGGDAIGAALAGYFASAGADRGVLLSPMMMVTGSMGAAVRVFDGRSLQPGKGARRPRGFTSVSSVPLTARAAVPMSLYASWVALNYSNSPRLAAVANVGIAAAKDTGALSRANVFEAFKARAAACLEDRSFYRPFIFAAGLPEGGLLTEEDFGAKLELDYDLAGRVEGERVLHELGEAGDSALSVSEWGEPQGIVCRDAQGNFAAISYYRAHYGLEIAEHELLCPPVAMPVMRGISRLAPGTTLECPFSIRFERKSNGTPLSISIALDEQHSLTI